MKAWGLWLISFLLVVVLVVVFTSTSLWNNLKSEWDVERAAAEYALNHSPLNHISSHDVFTANGAEEVFEGKDTFGRSWYAFVYGSPFQVRSVQKTALKPEPQIVARAKRDGLKVISVHLGYLDSGTKGQIGTNASFVWEVYGTTKTGNYEYAYFDAKSGKLVQSY